MYEGFTIIIARLFREFKCYIIKQLIFSSSIGTDFFDTNYRSLSFLSGRLCDNKSSRYYFSLLIPYYRSYTILFLVNV